MFRLDWETSLEREKCPRREPTAGRQLRDRLIDIAQEMIAAQGLDGLKARDLAAAAGCALGAIYTAFR